MKLGFRLLNPQRLGSLALILHAASAAAQDAAPPPEPPALPGPAPVVDAPALAPPAPLPPEPPPAEVKAAEEAAPLNINVWGRVDLTLSDAAPTPIGSQPTGDDLDDVYSTGLFELHTSGKLYGVASFTANFVVAYNPDIDGNVALMDGILQIEPSDYFNLWLGRMLVPVDRTNFSGPWFTPAWYYPGFGFSDGQIAVPREGPSGRNDGVTIWGQIEGGLLKYYAGAYELYNVDVSPLYSGRLALSLLEKEPGYYNSSTYYGKDILSIGVGAQYQKDGSVAPMAGVDPDNYTELNADVLFEKNLAGAGVLDLEGAVYKFNGDFEATDLGWFALASYLLPNEIGPGKLQPLVRVQQAVPSDDDADTATLIDAQLGYIVNSYALRFALGYRTGSAGDLDVQALYFGAQFLK